MQYRRKPISNIKGIDIFIKTESLDHFKKIETKFWDLSYKNKQDEILTFEKDLPFHTHFRKHLSNLPKGSHILEVACGTRGDILPLAKRGMQVIESDISLEAVREVKVRAEKMGILKNCSFIVCEAENIPIADNALDAVFIAASLHHLAVPSKGLREFHRVLKPRGMLVIGVEPNTWPYFTIFPLLWPLKKIIRLLRKRPVDSIADDHTHGFSYFSIQKIVRENGFEIIEIRPVKYFLEFYDSGIRLINILLKKNIKPYLPIQQALCMIDDILGKIPIIKWCAWHWNLIARKK